MAGEEERWGKGSAGMGARPVDQLWRSPELGPAGTCAAKAGMQKRGALDNEVGCRKAPGHSA